MNYTKHFECGCKVVVAGELTNAEIRYCPKHKAAPAMYEALKTFIEYRLELDYANPTAIALVTGRIQQALAKAEGRGQ